MKWLLLNQHFVSMSLTNCVDCVLEEALSSDLQLAQVLVSDMDYSKTGILPARPIRVYNLVALGGQL